ncbi:hypothetical protein ACXJJ3_41130 [Kribbella sp. WER1]
MGWIIAGLLAGVLVSIAASALGNHIFGKDRLRPAILVGLVLGGGVFLIVQAVAQQHSQQPTASPPAKPSTPATSAPVKATSAPTHRTVPPPTKERPLVQATSLLALPRVAEDTNDDIDLDDAGTTQIDGTTYGQALVYQCSDFCNGSSPQVREVTLGRKFKRFTATAVVLDSSNGSHRVDITLDGQAPRVYTVRPGHPEPIKLDVTGISRLRVQLYAPGPLKNPIQAGADSAAGRNGGGLPGVALGDPMLLP